MNQKRKDPLELLIEEVTTDDEVLAILLFGSTARNGPENYRQIIDAVRRNDQAELKLLSLSLHRQVKNCRFRVCMEHFHSNTICQNQGAFFVWQRLQAQKILKQSQCQI